VINRWSWRAIVSRPVSHGNVLIRYNKTEWSAFQNVLIAAVFDIELKAHWIPSEENVVAADAASRHDFAKLSNLGFRNQVFALRHRPSAPLKTSALRKQFSVFFTSQSPYPPAKARSPCPDLTNPSASHIATHHIPPHSLSPPTGSPPPSRIQLNQS
jgi:hypothetical protein